MRQSFVNHLKFGTYKDSTFSLIIEAEGDFSSNTAIGSVYVAIVHSFQCVFGPYALWGGMEMAEKYSQSQHLPIYKHFDFWFIECIRKPFVQ